MLQGEYLGMRLTIEDVDKENLAFFHYCAQGDFRLQKGKHSGLCAIPRPPPVRGPGIGSMSG